MTCQCDAEKRLFLDQPCACSHYEPCRLVDCVLASPQGTECVRCWHRKECHVDETGKRLYRALIEKPKGAAPGIRSDALAVSRDAGGLIRS